MYDEIDFAEFRKRFKLVCLKCGSEDCHITGDSGWGGTDVTAGDSATIAVGCNACKQNDMTLL